MQVSRALRILTLGLGLLGGVLAVGKVAAQGVTTAAMNGFVTDAEGTPLVGATIRAVHEPSGTQYATLSRSGGAFSILNMRIGGPYTVSAERVGHQRQTIRDVQLQLGQTERVEFSLPLQAVELAGFDVVAERNPEFGASRKGAATLLDARAVTQLPSVKRSTRDLIRLDPRNDGNFAFGGRSWLYNNISLDGSYFGNPFGLDDPAPGGQTAAEPVPFEAVAQVEVSVAPFDVREGGFTGANINTVTKSGTNDFRASIYGFTRNENLIGNSVRGSPVIADPDLAFLQSGFTASGPIVRNRLFVFANAEIERRDDPGTPFVANRDGTLSFGEARVDAAVLDAIRQRMIQVYDYDPGPYEGYVHETNNNKALLKLDWNVNANHNLTLRYNYLDAQRDLGPHPFVLSFNNAGRGPNATTLPFRNSGYRMNNELHSLAFEANSRGNRFANRFFASYNRFRDFRTPFSEDFPTIDIGEQGVGYTTLGHEPFSIHNILDQDVFQLTNNLSLYTGRHTLTVGGNFEYFGFFNSFNIFRHGVFFLPGFIPIGSTFASLEEFFAATDRNSSTFKDFRAMIGSGPYKGENIDVGQVAFYAQDEFLMTPTFSLTYGLRADLPMYFTDPVDNPFSRGLTALDENGNPETVDQSRLPDAKLLLSPRVGFNWDVTGQDVTRLRGGTGIFTGRVPFVWVGNVISNPGANPNLWGPGNPGGQQIRTSDDAILQQSFDLNAMDPEFTWPRVWTSNLAVDQRLPLAVLGTLEVVYGRDLSAVYVRNADLVAPVRFLSDGRPYYGGFGANELNPDGGAGIYVIDNTDEGYNLSLTTQLRRRWGAALEGMAAYTFTQAENQLKSTEIASVLWQNQPVQGNPNRPELSYSEFGQRHRIVGGATYEHRWSTRLNTQVGLFFEVAEGNRFAGAGGNRYSFIYAGDVNGDGAAGNDLIYIPSSREEIRLAPYVNASGQTVSAEAQWSALDAFIRQDPYLSRNRGQIAERFGAVNPWYSNLDLRLLQDFEVGPGARRQTVQASLDILNLANLLNSDWGVRRVASPAATSPLSLVGFDTDGEPIFNFVGPPQTFIDDPGIDSRWQIQLGLKLLLD